MSGAQGFDHPILTESLRRIRLLLEGNAALAGLGPVERQVVERLVHSSGDPDLAGLVRFSAGACERGLEALAGGCPILTDTAMAAAAVAPMAARTFGNGVHSVLAWAPERAPAGGTRAAAGMERALLEHPGAVVLIGSAPTALLTLLERVQSGGRGGRAPVLVVGMPVGFVGVQESKCQLAASPLPQIRLEGTRGGAGLAGASVNALLRHAWLERRSG